MEQEVILVLGENRLVAVRENLISKSEYFASLFSSNFKDSLNTEHRINYDIETKTLQTFIDWTSDSQTSADSDCRCIKPSLTRYVESSSDFDDLVQLLQLSVLFAAEILIKDLTDLIACHWLTPERSVHLWLLAKELNVGTLKSLALISCIERLNELPESLILDLPVEDFISLLGNVYAQAHPHLIIQLVLRWKLHNIPAGEDNAHDSRYPFTLTEKHLSHPRHTEIFDEQRIKNNIQCIVGHKLAGDNTERACIYCWNGSIFHELVEIRRYATVSAKNIVGRQAVSRGFDIYLVGGEYGMGTGRFEKEIWRYSTISKTWYYVTSLPEPRRHMAVAFLNERLFVIGGVGRHRLKLSTVEVYNIYTGEWSKTADIPEDFTSVPPIFHIDETLAFCKSTFYTYNPDNNNWMTSIGRSNCSLSGLQRILQSKRISVQFVVVRGHYLYIIDSSDPDRTRIWMVDLFAHLRALNLGDCKTPFNNQVLNGSDLIGFSYKDERVFVEVLKLGQNLSDTQVVHTMRISNLRDLCFGAPIGCFNIANPNRLETAFDDLDLEKLSS